VWKIFYRINLIGFTSCCSDESLADIAPSSEDDGSGSGNDEEDGPTSGSTSGGDGLEGGSGDEGEDGESGEGSGTDTDRGEEGESGTDGEGGTTSGSTGGEGGSGEDGGDGGSGGVGGEGGAGDNDETASFIGTDKTEYESGEPIVISFQYGDNIESLSDDWVGIYACDVEPFFHAEVWQWACGASNCANAVNFSTIVFDSLPPYNEFNAYHKWPIAPYLKADGIVNRCFKPVLLRFDGPSVPPYVDITETDD
jgi:hypothetical protein